MITMRHRTHHVNSVIATRRGLGRMIVVCALVAACVAPACARSNAATRIPPMMQVTGGLTDFQVLARDEHDRATARMSGRCYPADGVIEARACDRGAALKDLDWRSAGVANGGEWQAELADLRTGGPYDVELRLLDAKGAPVAAATVRSILVGDIWVLAGQSNMQGVAAVPNPPLSLPTVNAFTVSDHWALARDPLHPLFEAVDDVYWKPFLENGRKLEEVLPQQRLRVRAPGAHAFGPGMPFARDLYDLTGVPIGLIPCALGGSSLEQWDPERRDKNDSLYRAMMRRIAAAGGKVRGVVWYQGETDAFSPDWANTYQARFVRFVSTLRADLQDPRLAFLYVQIGRVAGFQIASSAWDKVRDAQRLAESQLERVAVVTAVDTTLTDGIHLDTASQMRIGKRLALQAAREVFGQNGLRRGARLREVEIDDRRLTVTLHFDEVNGRLRADGPPCGFSVSDKAGAEIGFIWRIDLSADRPNTVVLNFGAPLPEGAAVWYGRNLNPYVNLTDERDMGMLAFGPVAIPFKAE